VLVDSLRNACQTIAHAHGKGIIHRDLKPANVVVGPHGVTTVLDWGVARALNTADREEEALWHTKGSFQTSQEVWIGTRDYMAPEQAARRHGEVDQRTDIYGLGSLLFYLLTGESPHAGADYDQIVSRPTPRASQRKRGVPPELDSIAAKAMATKAELRYASAAEMEKDLEVWLAGGNVTAHSYSIRERLIRWTRNHLAAVGAAALAFSAVLVAATIAAGVVSVSEGRARNAERLRRQGAEAHRLEVETMLTQRDLEAAKNQLASGAAGMSEWRFDQDNLTNSWDTRYLTYALAMRPRPASVSRSPVGASWQPPTTLPVSGLLWLPATAVCMCGTQRIENPRGNSPSHYSTWNNELPFTTPCGNGCKTKTRTRSSGSLA
jgi:hypothetical protein